MERGFINDGTMQKCDFCLELGKEPACVAHCLTEALHYGTMENMSELIAEKTAKKLPGPTEPSAVIIHEPGANTTQNMLVGL